MSGNGCGPRLELGDPGTEDLAEARRADAIARARADRDALRRERGLPEQPGSSAGAGNRFAPFDPVERDIVRRIADEHPEESARMLAGYFFAETNRSISTSSVNNILNESPGPNPRRRVRSYQFTSLKRAETAPTTEAEVASDPAPSPPETPAAQAGSGDVYESLRALDAILATLSPGDRARAVSWLANVTLPSPA